MLEAQDEGVRCMYSMWAAQSRTPAIHTLSLCPRPDTSSIPPPEFVSFLGRHPPRARAQS